MRDTILHGDALSRLRSLPSESVHCIVTSPPYFGLRDYGRPEQLGMEPTPDAYVARMVEVFREARRVLRRDGTLWLNLGDSYANNPSTTRIPRSEQGNGTGAFRIPGEHHVQARRQKANRLTEMKSGGLKHKDLVGIPWRVAFALQADGWWLRSDIIWHKPNCMPESVRDRPTKAHEYVFLLTKSATYYYDADAVREPAEWSRWGKQTTKKRNPGTMSWVPDRPYAELANRTQRNRRSVWSIATAPYAGAHFAVMPPALVEPCVLAGCPGRVCETCGAPWVRVVEKAGFPDPDDNSDTQGRRKASGEIATDTGRRKTLSGARHAAFKALHPDRHLGYRPTCRCSTNTGAARGVVLDPFMGAGTVGVVARRHSRHYLGIELNADYIELAEARIANERQPVLWSAVG